MSRALRGPLVPSTANDGDCTSKMEEVKGRAHPRVIRGWALPFTSSIFEVQSPSFAVLGTSGPRKARDIVSRQISAENQKWGSVGSRFSGINDANRCTIPLLGFQNGNQFCIPSDAGFGPLLAAKAERDFLRSK